MLTSVFLHELQAVLPGKVFTPSDERYPGLVVPWNVAQPVRPLAVVVAEQDADVVATVQTAAEHGVRVGVSCTGHGATEDYADAVLVRTAGLDECTVHPEGWARVGAGVQWQRVLDAGAPHGLAGLCGSAPNVGIVGYTLGGGNGPVARTFGLASDHVRTFEIVTGDGTLRRVSAEEEPDLFWGLRGGKGSLGIVTAMEFDLMPVAELYGGAIFFDGAATADVLRAWQTWSETLPDEATTSIAILQLPLMPGVPEPLAGKLTVSVRFAYVGDAGRGANLLAPMRAIATPIVDMVGPMPYAALARIHSDPTEPMPAHEEATLLAELPPAALDVILSAAGPGADNPQIVVELRHLGGALSAPRPDSLVSLDDVAYSLLAIGIAAGPDATSAVAAHGAALMAAVAPWATGRLLPNFGASSAPDRFERSYDASSYARLARIAADHDPGRVFARA